MSIKKIFLFFSLIFFLFPAFCFSQAESTVVSTDSLRMKLAEQDSAFFDRSGYSSTAQAENIVASIIKTALSLLGIIFVILIIFSGYQWMTAGGNEEQVKKAQSRIKNAVIGVIIVVLAYSITAFVFKSLPGGGSGQTQTTDPQNL